MRTLKRLFWRGIYLFLPHQSALARVIKTRGFKRQTSVWQICRWTRHFTAVLSAFDPQTDLLMLGSSHIVAGVNPVAFRKLKGWNAAVASGDYRTAYYLYLYLRARWPRASGQAVLLGEDFWALAFQLEWAPNYYPCCILHHLIGMPYRTSVLIGACDRMVKRILKHLRKQSPRLAPRAVYRGYTVYRGNHNPTTIPQSDCVASRVATHLKFLTFKPTEIVWIERLISAIKEDGREVIFLRFPFRADYRERLPKEDLFTSFAQLETRGRLIDAQSLELPSKYWADMDHLTYEGANQFSQWLEDQLQSQIPTMRRIV